MNIYKTKKRNNNRFKLIYMAKPSYGGWVSFTAHLALKKSYPLFKLSDKKTEKQSRPFGYNVNYTNALIEDIKKLPGKILITAVDKKFYHFLPNIPNDSYIVIHDPTELKSDVLEHLPRFNVITIRPIVRKLLQNRHGIKSKFLHHPFYEFPIEKQILYPNKTKAISISRVDFDKHTDIIIDANDKLKTKSKQVHIYGALSDLYVYHKLRDTNFKLYYKGKFGKSFKDLIELLYPCKFMVDMSAIKGDGGGSQYTFLEAIYMRCILVLNSKWTDNVKTDFKHNHNCFIVDNSDDLYKLLKKGITEKEFKRITTNAYSLLKSHIKGNGW